MQTHTKVLFGTLLAVLVMAAPLTAEARPWGHGPAGPGYSQGQGPGGGPGWHQAIPQEKQQAFFALMRQHRDKMQPIREQIWTKRTTLDALSGNPKVEPKDITALVNEISALRTQVYAERKALAERVKKEFGIEMPYGGGYGMGRGYGHRGGHGGHGYGKHGW